MTEQQQKAQGSFEEFLKGSRIKKFGFLKGTVSKVTKMERRKVKDCNVPGVKEI